MATLINQQTDKISQQPENWENRNGTDLVQAFLRKWWFESDFTAPSLSLSLRLPCDYHHDGPSLVYIYIYIMEYFLPTPSSSFFSSGSYVSLSMLPHSSLISASLLNIVELFLVLNMHEIVVSGR